MTMAVQAGATATLRQLQTPLGPRLSTPSQWTFFSFAPTDQALIQSRGDAVEQVNVLPVLSRQQPLTAYRPQRHAQHHGVWVADSGELEPASIRPSLSLRLVHLGC